MLPKISVIVPVYNVEAYLPRCIESIQNQTLCDIEIILVDDGSTDDSGRIIDEYAHSDSRIIAIHKKNEGQSSARNLGLEKASGQYVGFVDSDDWVDLDMYQKMYEAVLNTSSEVCVCGRSSYSYDNEKIYKNDIENEIFDFNVYKRQDYIIQRLFLKHTFIVCNKLYKLDFIKSNNISFKDVHRVGSEDTLFNYSVILVANKICSINNTFYNHLDRLGSTTQTYSRGYMKRTSNLVNSLDEYSVQVQQKKIAHEIIPIFLVYFFQRNIFNLKRYSVDIKSELEEASQNKVFMRYVRHTCFSSKIIKHLFSLDYSFKGVIYIKLLMLLYFLRFYKILTRILSV